MRPIVFVPAFAVLFAGCGGAGGGSASPGTYAGDYTGTVTLDGTRSGALAMTIDSRGIVRGTFAVTDPGSSPTSIFPLGTFSILGTAGGDGSFSTTGESGINRFVISGRVPQSPRGPLLVVSKNGQGFSGTFAGGGPGPGPIPGNGLTFTGTAGSNVSGSFAPPYAVNLSALGQRIAFTVRQTGEDRSKTLEGFTDIPVGTTANVGGTSAQQATIRYEEGFNGWNGLGGTVRLVSSSPYVLQLTDVTMVPDPTSNAQGTFRISGTIRR